MLSSTSFARRLTMTGGPMSVESASRGLGLVGSRADKLDATRTERRRVTGGREERVRVQRGRQATWCNLCATSGSEPLRKAGERSVVARRRETPKKRNLKKVPFVELGPGRLQGVVSSGSDPKRVYVAFFEAGTTDFYCSTNNNRPCGGLYGRPCKHLTELLENAVAQYGGVRVSRHLQLGEELESAREIAGKIRGTAKKVEASEVFSRFLAYLRYVDLEGAREPLPELAYFVTG